MSFHASPWCERGRRRDRLLLLASDPLDLYSSLLRFDEDLLPLNGDKANIKKQQKSVGKSEKKEKKKDEIKQKL